MAWTICPSPSLGEKGTGADVDIKLYDANLEIYGKPIDTFSSLTYTDRWSADGDFKLVLPVGKYNDVKDAAYIYVDGRMFEIATINTKDASANNQLSLSGHNLNVLLSRVVISTPSRIQGKLETEIRTLVDSLCGSTSWQAIDKFTLGTLHGYARAMDANAMRGPLSDFLYTELNKRGFSFTLTYDDVNDEIVFDIIQSLNRTQDQTDNTFATFSASLGNVQNIEYERNETDYYNCAVVCDEDDTAPQTVIVDLSNGEPKRTIYVSGSSAGADTSEASDMFVLVGSSGGIFTSLDGISWTEQTSGTSESIWSVSYQNGRFIAGLSDGNVLTSTNGTSWTSHATGSSTAIEGSLYHEGVYCATGASFIKSSYDLSSWQSYSTSWGYGTIRSLFFHNEYSAFVWKLGTTDIVRIVSPDAFAWQEEVIADIGSASGAIFYETVLNESLIASVGYAMISSVYVPVTITSIDDGKTFNYNVISSLSGRKFLGVASGLGLIVAIGQPNTIAYSYDGITWTDCTPADSIDYITIAFDGTTFFAYGFTTRKVATSTDGINWTTRSTTGIVHNVDAVVYGTSSHTMSLYDIGYNALQNYRPVEVIDGEILPDAHPIFETEYKVGDIVDVIDSSRNIIVSKILTEAQTIYEPKKSIIIPKFGENYLSLKKYIEKVVDRLV